MGLGLGFEGLGLGVTKGSSSTLGRDGLDSEVDLRPKVHTSLLFRRFGGLGFRVQGLGFGVAGFRVQVGQGLVADISLGTFGGRSLPKPSSTQRKLAASHLYHTM